MIASLFFERKYVNFDVKAPWWAQILKVAIGLGIAVGIKSGLKALFLAAFGPSMFTNCLRYLLVVVFAVCIWPMTFPWFAAGCPLKREK